MEFRHEKDIVYEAFGLARKQHKKIVGKVTDLLIEKGKSISEVAEEIVDSDMNEAEKYYALFILGRTYEMLNLILRSVEE